MLFRSATLVKINTRIRSTMLIPKVTLRQLLLGMTLLGFYSMLLSWAAQGNVIGYSLSLSIALLAVLFMAYASVYWALYGLSAFVQRYCLPHRKQGSGDAGLGSESP